MAQMIANPSVSPGNSIALANTASTCAVPGHVEMLDEPIRSLVDGSEVLAQLRLPDGFEYEVAELGSGPSRSIARSYGF
jgi:hypothetical protein